MPARRFSVRVVVRSNRIPSLIGSMQRALKQAVLDTADQIQARGSQLAAVDTGSMRDSIYRTDGEAVSDYSTRVATARAENPDAVIMPEVRPEFVIRLGGSGSGGQADNYSMVIGVGVSHGIPNELGTVNMRSRPFMRPAAESARDDFTNRMRHIADNV